MYLKKLELSGFKSFASKTTLDFLVDSKNHSNQGVTAIVGPNGSGKSNIADAMRWVMGEQSMKALRGKKSEDIIFAGSGKKARLGSAQVTIYFDNSDKKIPVEFAEVAVTRKIYRSGDSEFLINGSRVRLQDIGDLLAKAGVGKESYAIVNQGMADSVLTAMPAERRTIIEDAAGVKQYQIKKERSIRKLETSRENLGRVKDLVEEIKPHLRMLKRQAEKSVQGEALTRELKEKQTKLFSWLWHNFHSQRVKFNSEKDDLGRVMMNIQREVDKLNDEIAKEGKDAGENKELRILEDRQRENRNRLNQLDRELIVTEGRIEIEKEKAKNLAMMEEIRQSAKLEIRVDFGYVKTGLEEIRQEQEQLIKRIENCEKLEDLQDIKEFARVIQQRLHDLKVDIDKGKVEKEQIDTNKERINTKEERIGTDDKVVIELKEKTIKLREEIGKLEEEIKTIDKKIREEIDSDREKRQKFFAIERMLRLRQDELTIAKDAFNEAKINLAKVEVREEDLRNEVKEELKLEPETLPRSEGAIDRETLEREISKLKLQLEQIGGIDPMILTEFEETDKRFQFLTTESEDLEQAISSLREVIKEMDHRIKESFESTFTEINKEFSKYFRIIFGGGNAHLTKTKIKSRKAKDVGEGEGEEDSVEEEPGAKEDEREEVGIEISACPPGKKISHLSMLSGGERSLTSLALLFAIISHNPPPFSVLDEVEAALDEANSRRFGRIITELSESTQFVIITHNRETMRQASLLYGVTMGEDGISKLLSVKLDQIGQEGKILQKA